MRFALLFMLVLTSACGKMKFFKSSQEKQKNPAVYTSGTLKVNVFYEPGAEPYADAIATPIGNIQIWNVLEQNLKALFPTKAIIVPKDLQSMSPMGPQNQAVWTYAEIKKVGDELGEKSAGDVATYNIFFVNGHAEGPSGPDVIGLHLSNTETMMIFKETVHASDSSDITRRYVEQSTLVHEMGHAVGLVNNGVSTTSLHEDSAHPHHCSEEDCVMHWKNEGASALKNFILRWKDKLNVVMFDEACIKDVTSHKKWLRRCRQNR